MACNTGVILIPVEIRYMILPITQQKQNSIHFNISNSINCPHKLLSCLFVHKFVPKRIHKLGIYEQISVVRSHQFRYALPRENTAQ